MHIGILQTGHAPEGLIDSQGDYGELFQRLLADRGLTFTVWSVVDGEFPPGPDAAEGWLITGSKHGAYEDHEWIPPLEELIRAIHARKLPLIGVCFGHQVIAQALGGRVEKFQGGWAVGPTEYRTADGAPLTLNAWHQDQVVQRPAEARVLASSPFCENAVLAYGDHVWTVQPHPEFDDAFIDGLIRTRGKGVVPDAQLEAADSRLGVPTDRDRVAQQMADFFLQARVR